MRSIVPHFVRLMNMHRNVSWKKTLDPIVLRCLPSNRRRIIERASIDVQFSPPEKGNKLSLVRTSFTIYHPDCFILLSDFLYYANHSYKKQRLRFDNSYKKFPCPNCPSVFVWKCTLKRHLRNECGQEPRFKCPHCDYRGKWKANICRHIKRVHKNCSIYVLDT